MSLLVIYCPLPIRKILLYLYHRKFLPTRDVTRIMREKCFQEGVQDEGFKWTVLQPETINGLKNLSDIYIGGLLIHIRGFGMLGVSNRKSVTERLFIEPNSKPQQPYQIKWMPGF